MSRSRIGLAIAAGVAVVVAGGIGLATAKMISNRLAAVGWEFATGTPPPGAEEQADG